MIEDSQQLQNRHYLTKLEKIRGFHIFLIFSHYPFATNCHGSVKTSSFLATIRGFVFSLLRIDPLSRRRTCHTYTIIAQKKIAHSAKTNRASGRLVTATAATVPPSPCLRMRTHLSHVTRRGWGGEGGVGGVYLIFLGLLT